MPKKKPKISLNLSAYNRRELLRNTLESIFRQKPGLSFEVIVIDDGSTDDTESLKDEFPIIYYQTGNQRYEPQMHTPCNIAAKMSRGDIIIQQNAECYHWSDDVIAQLAAAVKIGKAVFATVINQPNTTLTEEELTLAVAEGVVNTTHYSGKRRMVPWFFCGAIMRKDWEKLGGYRNISHGVDVDFGNRMKEAGMIFEWLDDCIVIHQTHDKGEQ